MGLAKHKMLRLLKDEDGAAVVEYGVLIALIIAVCILIITAVGTKTNGAFQKFNSRFG